MKLLLSSTFLLAAIAACGSGDPQSDRSAGSQGPVSPTPPSAAAPLSVPSEAFALNEDERDQLRFFVTDAGYKGGVVLYDAERQVIAADQVFPQTAASAKVCIVRDDDVELSHAQAFKSCCDKKGTSELRWEKAAEAHCWDLSPVLCNNAKFRLRFTFSDGDTVIYGNPLKKA